MLFQSGQNFNVNYKLETTFAVAAAGGAGATRLRATGGGLSLARATINPNDMRADMRTSMGRYGSRNVSGSYPTDLAVGGVDALIEAALRGTFAAASADHSCHLHHARTSGDELATAAHSRRRLDHSSRKASASARLCGEQAARLPPTMVAIFASLASPRRC
jgi:hypothetical protein